MNILWGVWEVIVNCIECYFLFYLLSKQLGVAPSKKKWIYCTLLILISAVSVMNLCNVHYTITIIVISIAKIGYAFLFGSNITKKLLWGCIGAFVAVIGNSLISIILTWLSGIDIAATLLPGNTRFIITLLYCLFIIIVCWAFSRIHRQTQLSMPVRYQLLMLGIMLVGFFAVAEMISFSIQSVEDFSEGILLTVASIAILLTTLTTIFLFERIGSVISEKVSAETQLSQLHYENENKQRIEEIVKVWRHDFHNYIEVLQIYLEKQDYEQLRKYIGETRHDFQHALSLIVTGNSAVDAILSSKLLSAYHNHIDVRMNIQQLASLPLSETEMCVLLGNLLDNAIEACTNISDGQNRYIDIQIYPQQKMLFISVTNCASGNYQYRDGHLISS